MNDFSPLAVTQPTVEIDGVIWDQPLNKDSIFERAIDRMNRSPLCNYLGRKLDNSNKLQSLDK